MLKLNQVIIPLEAPIFVPNLEEDGTDWDFERIETSYYQINEEVSKKNSRSESYNINQSFDMILKSIIKKLNAFSERKSGRLALV